MPPPDRPETTTEPAPRALRVLVVDDTPLNQRLMQAVLELRGHTSVLADNGREAVAALARETFDIVLMDLQMGEMDGFDATAAIRARERSTGGYTPIVAITAQALDEDRDRCLAAGMDGYVSKPIRFAELIELVERLTAPGAGPAAAAGGLRLPAERVRADLFGRFLADSRRLHAEIRGAVERRDGGALERAAHILRGSIGYFAAGRALDLVRRLEELGKAADCGDSAAEACRELGDELARLERLQAGEGERD